MLIKKIIGHVLLISVCTVAFTAHATNVSNLSDSSVAKVSKNRSNIKKQSQEAVDINAADAETLSTLKGIGPKKAAAIVAYRTDHGAFKSANDLEQVHGFSKKVIDKIQANNPGRVLIK